MSKSDFFRITIDTNPDYCNLNCIMCEDHSKYASNRCSKKKSGTLRPFMPKKMLQKIISEATKMGIKEVIPSTMGEPLLYPHIETLIDLCKKHRLSLNLTTNGTFPAKEKNRNVEYWAERIVPIGSDVKISWNGATAETHNTIMEGASLATHIDYTERFIKVRDKLSSHNYCYVTMQLTFMRKNMKEILRMVEMAIDMGFDRIKGHQLWAHFSEIESEKIGSYIEDVELWNQIVEQCQQLVNKHNAASKRKFKFDNFLKLRLNDSNNIVVEGKCPFLGREIWIDPTGQFNVCCAPDQQRKTLGNLGNINQSTLIELVNSEPYIELKQNYHNHPLCKKCNMRRPL